MKILITGVCGFVGSSLAKELLAHNEGLQIFGLDNLIRPGSEGNKASLAKVGVTFYHGDLRNASDLDALPTVDWVIDAAANPSVLAGVDGQTSSRQIIEHNLNGTFNLLEYCKRCGAGLILLSTSRTYSISHLRNIKLEICNDAFQLASDVNQPPAITNKGIGEAFSTAAPISLYGATKLASETLAAEYGSTFSFPVRINRCGVMAGAGQFGRPDQGIFAYWIHAWQQRAPLKYIGFDGQGHQVRDCLHPKDLYRLVIKQIKAGSDAEKPLITNASGGIQSARSLRQLSQWCEATIGSHQVNVEPNDRAFDLPWVVLDSSLAEEYWDWRPRYSTGDIFLEIAQHARENPKWLDECKGH